ncbi:ribonuclease III [Candidatus Shapirobacteria bacterium CG09_land_8_20_14_0_10_38_17]|uniref:Ribonuclease 3 n=1 Tax=Candidatus Shapirobacteria bacterium CG09_land_8_20_14_0_10_38_17 TaxID=1974884 RepID=A0A2H0WRU4_9BACT|nr:MAG: ribonuclease III [Candidatus Shapirobacteria bacterium CG09_land_8_20_14_0_10_38_17]
MFSYTKIEKVIGIKFKNKALLERAFTHRSYLNEHPKLNLSSNERLEFLGDAILEFWVSDQIFNRFPHQPEGYLTNFRAKVVCTESLAKIAQKLNLNDFLLLSRGEKKEGGRQNRSLLANTFEALIGAIYKDQGLKAIQSFLKKNILPQIQKITKEPILKDYKSLLQEITQKKWGNAPDYQLIKSSGPDHNKTFVFAILMNNQKIGEGRGKSKQVAQQNAAQKALEGLKIEKKRLK